MQLADVGDDFILFLLSVVILDKFMSAAWHHYITISHFINNKFFYSNNNIYHTCKFMYARQYEFYIVTNMLYVVVFIIALDSYLMANVMGLL
jgi:hypothetical protein